MTNTPRFTRTKENFTCENCSHTVSGNGYTNHCSNCLWSKHVDVNPGDRASTCGGLMKPTGIEIRHGDVYILQECVACGHRRPNISNVDDNKEIILKLSVAKL